MSDIQGLSGLDLSGIIDKISKNPEMLNAARDILSSVQKPNAEATKKENGEQNQNQKNGIDNGIGELASVLPALIQSGEKSGGKAHNSNREALLRALRPYLSAERQNALDKLLSFEKLGALLAAVENNQILK